MQNLGPAIPFNFNKQSSRKKSYIPIIYIGIMNKKWNSNYLIGGILIIQ